MLHYQSEDGKVPFETWFNKLDAQAALRVTTGLARLENGNTSALKTVSKGVHELVLDFGPGYRVYLGLDGADWVILLGGSSKARQSAAIADAQAAWQDYRKRKRASQRGMGDK